MADKNITPEMKIAILLTSMNKQVAVNILKNLPPNMVGLITKNIRLLTSIKPEQQVEVYEEFQKKLYSGISARGGDDVARALLEEAVGDTQANEFLKDDRKDIFSSIVKVNSENLTNILVKEQPSVIAMVLAFLPSAKAGEILGLFDKDLREIIITRLAQKKSADPEIVDRIEKIFVDKVASVLNTTDASTDDTIGGPQFCADVFQSMDKTLEEEMLGAIQESAPESADEIRDLMFTFNDIVRLTGDDIQKILRQISIDKLVIALRGADSEVSNKITSNLSKRAQETLVEEGELLGKIKLSDVQQEQKNIVAIIRSMEMSGDITLSQSGGTDEYV